MDGFFGGIIGSIVGSGIPSAFGAIPIPEDASRALEALRLGGLPVPPANWFSPIASDEQTERSTKQNFDKIVQHVTGAMQVIKPCMQIIRAVGSVQPPAAPASVSKYEYDYRPRRSTFASRCTENCEPCGSSSWSSSIQHTAVKKTMKMERSVNRSSSASNHAFNAEKMGDHCGYPKASLKHEADGKTSSKDTKKCALCHAQMKVQSKLSLKPCGHVYCINCLFSRRITDCPKCKSRR